jgi:hypothetical protein
MQVKNGTSACELPKVRWRKSQASNPSGSCVEMAKLPGGAIAMRNSRHPAGPALIYTRAEVAAFLTGVKNGEFDDLYLDAPDGRGDGAALSPDGSSPHACRVHREWLTWPVCRHLAAETVFLAARSCGEAEYGRAKHRTS